MPLQKARSQNARNGHCFELEPAVHSKRTHKKHTQQYHHKTTRQIRRDKQSVHIKCKYFFEAQEPLKVSVPSALQNNVQGLYLVLVVFQKWIIKATTMGASSRSDDLPSNATARPPKMRHKRCLRRCLRVRQVYQ